MNIAINTLPLATEHRMRGTGVYTNNLIEALQKYGKKHSYSFFTRVQDIPKNTDVVHYPFFDPFFLTLPPWKRHPTIVTVHDLIPLVFPDKFPPGLRGKLKWYLQKTSLRGATRIITDSECSKGDIVRLIGKRESEVKVVPLAPSPGYKPVTDKEALTSVKSEYHLPDEYVLYVGDVNWNKNVTGLIEMWKMVKSRLPKTRHISLVLIGSAFVDYELKETRDLLHLIDHLNVGKTIIRPGFIKDEDMSSVYSASSCVVLPSWYEGFGLPVLESFVCGVPVVATNRGSVPEISGPASVSDPQQAEAFASAILNILSMPARERSALIYKGWSWVKQFSWQRVARETVAIYENTFHHHSDL